MTIERPLGKAATMEDVAAEAGVSRALVSLVMRKSPQVSEHRRTAVLEAAARLGYSPNRLASRLASKRTRTVGVLLLDLHNPVFADIHDGVQEGLSGSGNQIIVAAGSMDLSRQRETIRSLADLQVDGIVLAGYTGSVEDLAPVAATTPIVVVTRELSAPGIDSVLVDDFTVGRLAVEHLHSLGHRHIAHMDKPEWLPYDSRREGYLSAMARHGLPPLIIHGDMTETGAHGAMARFLAEGGVLPTGIFADNDLSAIGVLSALREADIAVPAGVSVIGCDNTALAQLNLIDLTSIDQHARELGRLAGQQLLRRIGGERTPAETRKLAPTLHVRQSTAAPGR